MEKKIDKKKIKEVGKGTVNEFKEFIAKGNIIDMAVGVIIGGAFGKIVTSLVDNILMPLIGILIGGLDFTNLTFNVKDATIGYGIFIQNIVDFLIVAVCIFFVIKVLSKFKKKEEVVEEAPTVDNKEELLKEIRDLLKEATK